MCPLFHPSIIHPRYYCFIFAQYSCTLIFHRRCLDVFYQTLSKRWHFSMKTVCEKYLFLINVEQPVGTYIVSYALQRVSWQWTRLRYNSLTLSIATLHHNRLFVQTRGPHCSKSVWPITHQIQTKQTCRYHEQYFPLVMGIYLISTDMWVWGWDQLSAIDFLQIGK